MGFETLDYDAIVQLFFEVVEEQGEEVIRNEWDTNSMGAGSGSESVFRFRDLYWGISADNGKTGPFKTLPDALEETRAHFITGAVVSVHCEEQVIGMLNLENDADEHVFDLNGKPWTVVTSQGGEQKITPVKRPRKR